MKHKETRRTKHKPMDYTGRFICDLYVAAHDREADVVTVCCVQCLHKETVPRSLVRCGRGRGCRHCKESLKGKPIVYRKPPPGQLGRFVVCRADERFRNRLHVRLIDPQANATRITACGLRWNGDSAIYSLDSLSAPKIDACEECQQVANWGARFEEVLKLTKQEAALGQDIAAGCGQ